MLLYMHNITILHYYTITHGILKVKGLQSTNWIWKKLESEMCL